MGRVKRRVITCDVVTAVQATFGYVAEHCTNEFSVNGSLDWKVLGARARDHGWKQTGDRHRCPQHRHTPLPVDIESENCPEPKLTVIH